MLVSESRHIPRTSRLPHPAPSNGSQLDVSFTLEFPSALGASQSDAQRLSSLRRIRRVGAGHSPTRRTQRAGGSRRLIPAADSSRLSRLFSSLLLVPGARPRRIGRMRAPRPRCHGASLACRAPPLLWRRSAYRRAPLVSATRARRRPSLARGYRRGGVRRARLRPSLRAQVIRWCASAATCVPCGALASSAMLLGAGDARRASRRLRSAGASLTSGATRARRRRRAPAALHDARWRRRDRLAGSMGPPSCIAIIRSCHASIFAATASGARAPRAAGHAPFRCHLARARAGAWPSGAARAAGRGAGHARSGSRTAEVARTRRRPSSLPR